MDQQRNEVADWLRWIAWGPAVIVGMMAGMRLGRWAAAAACKFVDVEPGQYLQWWLASAEGFGLAAGVIWTAWVVAPARKAAAARVAAGALVFLCGWAGGKAFLAGSDQIVAVVFWATCIALPVTARGIQQPGTTRVPGR